MNDCPDFAMISTTTDKFIISADIFSSNCFGPYIGAQYSIVDKDDLINGRRSPAFQTITPDATLRTLQPVKSLSLNSNLYVLTTGDGTAPSLGGRGLVKLITFTGSVPNVVRADSDLPIDRTNTPPNAVQPNTLSRLDTGIARVLDAFSFGNMILFALNDGCTPPEDTQSRSCIRLVRINPIQDRVLQDFDIGARGSYLLSCYKF